MRPIRTWIVVADGVRCRIVANTGPGRGVEPLPDMDFRGEQRRLRDIMADRPGRTFDSAGKGRHAMTYSSDPVREDERHFARTLVDLLEVELAANAFDRLILVAPPRTLGDLRAMLAKQVRERVHHEVPKDLTRLPFGDLAKHLQDHVLV